MHWNRETVSLFYLIHHWNLIYCEYTIRSCYCFRLLINMKYRCERDFNKYWNAFFVLFWKKANQLIDFSFNERAINCILVTISFFLVSTTHIYIKNLTDSTAINNRLIYREKNWIWEKESKKQRKNKYWIKHTNLWRTF